MKKLILIAAIIVTAFVSHAQTNLIVFPELLSCTNTVLMTNAEFRCTSGNRIIFKNDCEYKSFTGEELTTNELSTLNLTVEKLNLDQEKMVAANKQFWINEKSAEQKYIAATEAKKKSDAAAKLLRIETEAGFYQSLNYSPNPYAPYVPPSRVSPAERMGLVIGN